MLVDFLLAALHHLLVFGLIAMLVTESVLLRGAVAGATVRRLAGVDAGYGATAALLVVVGLLRVWFGVKGHDFYLHNPWFHAKLGAFVLVGLLSIAPTLRFLRWRKALKSDAAFAPEQAELASMRRFVRVQLVLVAIILVCAAGMARFGGF